MSAVFIKVLNMSITASWLILAVILARLLLKKAPKWVPCLLWALVAVRLICPFSFESTWSLIPSSQTIPSNIALQHEPAINSGIPIVNETINPIIAESFTPTPTNSANPLQIMIPVASLIWIAGIVIMLSYALVSYLKLKKTVSVCVPVKEGILSCDEVKAPFILGVLRPVIYVPSSMQGERLDYVLRHEAAHLQRHDHWWKPLGFFLLSVYWFHPLYWIAYILLCRDIEMACDEKVIRDMDKDDMAAYSQALLDCSFRKRRIAACPLAFGEIGVKERVRGVLNYKKPAFWVIIIAVIVCIVLAVCLMTDPKYNFKIELTEVERAAYFNLFVGDDCQGELNAEQIDEMVESLSAVSKFRRSNQYKGMTPGYQLSVLLKDGTYLYANGYHATEDMVELIVDGRRYSIMDQAFAKYLRTVCSGFSKVSGVDGQEIPTVNIRTDVCALYLKVLEDLWNVDSGLNDGISQLGIDLSELSHLTESEKETVMQEFASRHQLPYIAGTWEELCEQGYIDKENLYWEDGLFFSIRTNEDAVWYLPAIKDGDSEPELAAFDAQKWRSGLGAYYFGQCTAQKNADGKWSYTVGQEAIS